jgi:hypothetical protein
MKERLPKDYLLEQAGDFQAGDSGNAAREIFHLVG